uniref:Uncharacterized protein n=1 Tax=Romanomermis culicivorax TaxID=13658 RepID=A0A915IY31_ROMCU
MHREKIKTWTAHQKFVELANRKRCSACYICTFKNGKQRSGEIPTKQKQINKKEIRCRFGSRFFDVELLSIVIFSSTFNASDEFIVVVACKRTTKMGKITNTKIVGNTSQRNTAIVIMLRFSNRFNSGVTEGGILGYFFLPHLSTVTPLFRQEGRFYKMLLSVERSLQNFSIMSIRVTRDQIPGLIPNNPSVTSITASCSESLDAIMKDSRLPNVENSSNLESKIVDLEAIIISKNRKIDKLDIQKQDLTLSIAEMGKNYAALQNDNQMWKQQCKSLVDARVKFENEEVNVLRVAYADKLKESSELNLELTTCQNQLETIKQILQKTAKSRNFLWDEKQSLEQK